jgi:hypothetical protein
MSRFGIADPNSIIEKARKKALETLKDSNPPLTKLELAFRQKYLNENAEVIRETA